MKERYIAPKGGASKADMFAVEHQFATRERANDFVRLMRTLPDPDPILRKMGRGMTALRELLSDSHLESVWSVRCSTISGAEWFMAAGGESAKEKEAAQVFASVLANLDMPRVIEEMMDAVAYGFSPLEILWTLDNSHWDIADIVGKPPEWFEFNQNNRLVFRTGVTGTEELPENRFLLARHRPSYANPYGVKVFSKCYWPATFKKNGFRWWTVFVEKYGGAFMYGKYPSNASEQYKKELLQALEAMISDAVAIAPEGAEITIESLAQKGGISSVHKEYIEAANAEISKAVLGQTLTTEIGASGSYAAAKAHNLVRADLAAADRKRIGAIFNRLAALWSLYNFGSETAPPTFEFVKDEDLQDKRAERDTKLYSIGWRPSREYIINQYEMSEDDFELQNDVQSEFKRVERPHERDCSCGACRKSGKQSLFTKIFSTKNDRRRVKDSKLMNDFADDMAREGQGALDAQIEKYRDALGTVSSFEEAEAALLQVYNKDEEDSLAHIIDEVRFAAQCVGGSHA